MSVRHVPSCVILLSILRRRLRQHITIMNILLSNMTSVRELRILSVHVILIRTRYGTICQYIQLIISRFRFSVFRIFPCRLTNSMVFSSRQTRCKLLIIQTRQVRLFRLARRLNISVLRIRRNVCVSLQHRLFKSSLINNRLRRPLNRDIRIFLFRKRTNNVHITARIFRRITTTFSYFMCIRSHSQTDKADSRFKQFHRSSYQTMMFFHRTKDSSTSRPFIPSQVMSSSHLAIFRILRFISSNIHLIYGLLIRFTTFFIVLISTLTLFTNRISVLHRRRFSHFLSIRRATKDISTESSLRSSITSHSLFTQRTTSVSSPFRTRTQVTIGLLRTMMDRCTIFTNSKSSIQNSTSHHRLRRFLRINGQRIITFNRYLRRLRPSTTSQRVFMQVSQIRPLNVRCNSNVKRYIIQRIVITSGGVSPRLLNVFSLFSNLSTTIRQSR